MYILKTEHSFDAAHFLAGYNGKCKNIHGHRWRVVAEIKSGDVVPDGQSRGMIVDFSTFKDDIKNIVDDFDHSLIIEKKSLKQSTFDALVDEGFRVIEVDFRPTAENFAKYFYDIFSKLEYGINSVTVYETPNNCAVYSAD